MTNTRLPKIYYIANARMLSEKAHGIQLAKMCEAFLEAGADIELVVPDRMGTKRNVKEFYALKREIPIRTLPVFDVYENAGEAGFVVGSLSFMVSNAMFLFSKWVRGERFIVYTIDMDQFSFALLSLLPFPLFVELHDSKKRGFLYSGLFRRARGLVVINTIIARELSERFQIPRDRILVFANGVDKTFFHVSADRDALRKSLKLPSGPLVLYSGRLYTWKEIGIIGDAARLLHNATFLIVGGTKEDYVKVTGSEASTNMMFAGSVQYRDMPRWLAAADVFVLLGTRTNEYSHLHTSPMKLYEYFAAGRPVVASSTPAVREMCSDSEVFFYEPDDATSLARVIERVLRDQVASTARVAAAHERLPKVSWSRRAEAVLKHISELLGPRATSAKP